MDYGDESDHDLISTEMLEDIRDRSQSHLNVNEIEAHYKIRYFIRQRQSEWKGALKATRNMGKVYIRCLDVFQPKTGCSLSLSGM